MAGGAKSAAALIRDGASHATVELTIANGGPDPFHPHGFDTPPTTLTVTLKLTKIDGNRATSNYWINGTSVTQRRVKELAEFYNYEVQLLDLSHLLHTLHPSL